MYIGTYSLKTSSDTLLLLKKSVFFALNSASELINLLFRGGRSKHIYVISFQHFVYLLWFVYLLNQFSSHSTKCRDAKYHSSHMAFTCVAVYLTIYLDETAYCRPAAFLPGSQRLFLPPLIASRT